MFSIAATRGRFEQRTARCLSSWTRDHLREVALVDLDTPAGKAFGADTVAVLACPEMDGVSLRSLVFLGHMSLVGPRPALPDQAEKHADHVRRRLVVKPGLTGLWQVNGRKTISVMLCGSGAN